MGSQASVSVGGTFAQSNFLRGLPWMMCVTHVICKKISVVLVGQFWCLVSVEIPVIKSSSVLLAAASLPHPSDAALS